MEKWFVISFSAMRDLETERNQRQSELTAKREELDACQRQLQTTTHHREQLERAISREREKSYGLRLVGLRYRGVSLID